MSPAGDLDWSLRRILVIEDDAETLERIRAILAPLRLAGLDTLRDGAKVLEVLARFPADMILMEASPAGADGLDVLRAIRGRESPNRDVVVAVMVAMADAERLRRMCGIGIESFIRKPVTADVLLVRVSGAISNPRRFISSLTYFGPDRRRPRVSNDPYIGPEKRRIVRTKEAPPPPRPAVAVPNRPAAPPRRDDSGDGNWFEAAPAVHKPVLSDNIPLVDPPEAKKPKVSEAIEVVQKAKRPSNEDWSDALGPTAKKEVEEEPAFDIMAMVNNHNEWLNSGGTAGAKAVLEGQDLSGAQMAGVNLSGASLRNVILSTANLRATILQSVDLRGSILTGADLSDGDLTSSNLRRADLSTAKLQNTRLAGTDLAGASLRGAKMEGTDLKGANLLDADIASTDLSMATGLIQSQINKARPNAYTVLPPGIRRPAVE